MRQQPDLTPGFQIPQANHFIPARGEHRLSVCQQADCGGAFGVFTEDEAFLALALTPPVTPLPAAQIGLGARAVPARSTPSSERRVEIFRRQRHFGPLRAGTARAPSTRPMAVQQLKRAVEVILLDGLLSQIHVRGVGELAGFQFTSLDAPELHQFRLARVIDAIDGDGGADDYDYE